jgi:hypothetical protein
MAIALAEVTTLFRAYHAGRLSRVSLEAALATRVLTPPSKHDPATSGLRDDQNILAYKLAETVCSMTGPDEDVQLFAGRVLDCLGQVSDPGDTLDLLPLIIHHDEFSVLVSKQARGLISPDGLRSVIAKRFAFDSVRSWLEGATPERLQSICGRLEANDFQGLQSLLVLP